MPWPVVFPVEENTKMNANQFVNLGNLPISNGTGSLGQEPYVSKFIHLMGTEPLVARQVEELRG